MLPYTWNYTGTMPAGITLSTAGVFSGTPTAAGSSALTVKVTDGVSNTATEALTLVINAAATAVGPPQAMWPGVAQSTNLVFSWWQPATGTPDYYKVYRNVVLYYGDGVNGAANPGGVTQCTGTYGVPIYLADGFGVFNPLTPNTTYTYTVTSVYQGVESAVGPALQMTTLANVSTFTATGSISGTTLTITGTPGGSITPGMTFTGTGVRYSTNVTANGTGTGGAGTYTINRDASQTVASTTLTFATAPLAPQPPIDPATGRSLGATRMPLPPGVAGIAGEAWSPQGTEIAFIERIDDRERALWVSHPDGSAGRKLVEFASYTLGGVAWTPDARELLYGALADDRMQIFAVARTGGAPRQVTHGDVNIMHPSVSPDGRFVAASRIPWRKELRLIKLR